MQDRATQVYDALKPQNEFQAWMVDEIALFSIRIDRCQRMERRARDKFSLRAELNWDDDRRHEAEVLGGLLSSRPAETVEALRRPPHGCDWLMTRWAMPARAADLHQTWNEEQVSLAFDLLATPALFRDPKTLGESIDFDGKVVERAETHAEIARRMVAELEERREVVAGLDEVERALVETDHDHDSNPELRRLRRYESMLHTRLRWCIKQITTPSPHKHANPGLMPRWLDEPIPSPKPEPRHPDEIAAEHHNPKSWSPPFCLTPDEFPPIGQSADIPTILKSRKAKRAAKAEALRQARRKKVEELTG